MAASESLNKVLFHGTASHIKGGIVQPSQGLTEKAAYATDSKDLAAYYAREAAKREGTLFGMVYRVSPVSQLEHIRGDDPAIYGDPEGLKIGKVVSYPIPNYPVKAKT